MVTAPYRDDLNRIVVLNPKGGCGKTTLATNLASYFALRGPPPTLIDTDPNGYTSRWLDRRPPGSSTINGFATDPLNIPRKRSWGLRPRKEAGAVIIDTPAGLGEREVSALTYDAACVLIPILPSEFDIQVTTRFIANLMLVTQFELPVAVVANRTRKNTRSLARLMGILTSLETPTIAVWRSSQTYVQAAELGLGICELPHHQVKKDLAQLDLVIDWLDRRLCRNLEPGLISRINPLPKLFVASGARHGRAD